MDVRTFVVAVLCTSTLVAGEQPLRFQGSKPQLSDLNKASWKRSTRVILTPL